jgi:argonaute-like protein implicated in RNA metabolism and viral defense
MIGRGSRVLPNKQEFIVIDLGNNLNRFGLWDSDTDWKDIFKTPEIYLSNIQSDEEIERNYKYIMPDELRNMFRNSSSIDFDVKAEHTQAMSKRQRPKVVMEHSIEQHIRICSENSAGIDEALMLADLLKDEIEFRVRVYTWCLSKTSESYVKWLQDDYKRKLKFALIRNAQRDYRV